MKRLKRVLIWVLMNGALAWCIWAGVHGNTGAGNVAVFVIWFYAVVSLIAVLNPDGQKQLRDRGRAVPRWISVAYGLGMVLFLAWHGWWFTAVAVLLMCGAQSAIYDDGPWSSGSQKCTGKLPDPTPAQDGWILVSDRLPEPGHIVWLHGDEGTWIGSLDDTDGDGWMWSNSYGQVWYDGEKWDGDCEQDDYKPTHWKPLPEPPHSSNRTK